MKTDIINKSPYVRDYDYNNIGYDDEKNRFSSTEELDKYLDKVFIPKNIYYKKVKGKNSNEERCLSIQFNKILSLKCSNEEVKHILQYLCDRDIHVGGFVSTLEGEYDNYDYEHKYKLPYYPESINYEEQKALFDKYLLYKKTNDPRKNDIAKQIGEGSLRLITYVTYKYSLFTDIDINEFNSYGCEGLMLAIDKYDPSLGYKFSTFAFPYIKNRVNNGLRELRGFGKNRSFYSEFIKYKNVVEKGYSEDAGIKVTIYDNPQILEDIINLMKDTCSITEKMELYLRNKLNVIYHNELPVDLISDYDMEEKLIKEDEIKTLWEIIETLPEKERDVIFKRFGFNGDCIMTLEDIGKIYGVTRERVRQIETKALARFKNHENLR